MKTLNSIIDYLNNFSIYNNTLLDFVVSFSILIFSSFAFFVFKKVLKKRLDHNNNLLNVIDDPNPVINQKIQILQFLNKILNGFSIFLFSLYFSTRNLEFPSSFDTLLRLIIFGGLSFIIINVLLNIVDHFLDYQEKRIDKDYRHITEFLKLFLKVIIITFVGVWFLSNLGINVNTFVAGLGITGIAIALALQTTISDLFASITLYFDKPFEIGDFVAVGKDSGTIEQIGLRSTQIRTLEGQLLIISNQDLTTARIHNFKKMDSRRVVQKIGVDYSTPYEKLELLPKLIEEIISSTNNVTFDRAHLVDLSDSTIDIEIVYYINSKDYEIFMDAKQSIILRILHKFQDLEVSIPYPTQRLQFQPNPLDQINVGSKLN